MPRLLNVGLLVGGFGIGQGSIFVAQTWLVAKGELDLLAAFGTHFSFAVLAMMFIDAGALTTLARHVAHLHSGQTSKADISRIFWETSTIRLVLALVTVISGAVYATVISTDGFSTRYVLWSAPGLLLCAISAAGLLDGLKLSGISGLTGSITNVSSALALAIGQHPTSTTGALLGGAFSLGALLTVATQWAVLVRRGLRPARPRVTRRGLVKAGQDGLAMLFGALPGQLYNRFQLLVSAAFLGAATTAFLVYSKQILSGVVQVIHFVLRVEFPGLVQLFSQPDKRDFATIFGAQKPVAYLAIGSTIATLLVGILMTYARLGSFASVGWLLIAFSPTVLTVSTMGMLAQALAALSRYTTLSSILAIFAVVGMIVSYLALSLCGVYAFAVGEIASHVTGLLLMYLALRERRPAGSLAAAR